MKVVETNPDLCAGCLLCEDTCSEMLFRVEDGSKSAIRITETDDGYDINVCNQCGECIEVCPVEAIQRKKNTIIVNKTKCIGCFSCVGFCPQGAMRQHEEMVEPFKCISCGSCTEECPTEAIVLVEKEQ